MVYTASLISKGIYAIYVIYVLNIQWPNPAYY
jgi:hypothetical protein